MEYGEELIKIFICVLDFKFSLLPSDFYIVLLVYMPHCTANIFDLMGDIVYVSILRLAIQYCGIIKELSMHFILSKFFSLLRRLPLLGRNCDQMCYKELIERFIVSTIDLCNARLLFFKISRHSTNICQWVFCAIYFVNSCFSFIVVAIPFTADYIFYCLLSKIMSI